MCKADAMQQQSQRLRLLKLPFPQELGWQWAIRKHRPSSATSPDLQVTGPPITAASSPLFSGDTIYLCCREIKAQAKPQLRNTWRSKQQAVDSISMKCAQHLEIGSCCFNLNQLGPLEPSGHIPNEKFQLTLDFSLS